MNLPLKWEFPGGKIRADESPEECLRRELREELGVDVSIVKPLIPVTHQYPAFSITLYPFRCAITGGEITLYEHKDLVWLAPDELHSLSWAEADVPVVDQYLLFFRSRPTS